MPSFTGAPQYKRPMHGGPPGRCLGPVPTIGAAVATPACDPYPPGSHRGRYNQLRVGRDRAMHVVDRNVITIRRIDRVADAEPGRLSHAP